MSIVPPAPGEPRRPEGPRDPGDAWVVAPDGRKYWGRFGAAGLLAVDDARGVLLQERVSWSHFGGTWGIPGGARHEGESALDGALRESQEEAGIPDGAVRPLLTSVFDLGYWSYTTVVGVVEVPFEPQITDAESVSLAWVAADDVTERPLHPGFEASWAALRELQRHRPRIVVDIANVMGAEPNGWWRDRVGAAQRLLTRLEALADCGIAAEALDLGGTHWFPTFTAVVEGQARGVVHAGNDVRRDPVGHDAAPHSDVRRDVARDDDVRSGAAPHGDGGGEGHRSPGSVGRVEVVAAQGSGDDTIVDLVRTAPNPADLIVVTSDRELRSRVTLAGGQFRGVRWLLELLDT